VVQVIARKSNWANPGAARTPQEWILHALPRPRRPPDGGL